MVLSGDIRFIYEVITLIMVIVVLGCLAEVILMGVMTGCGNKWGRLTGTKWGR